jgi:hypothetical protein
MNGRWCLFWSPMLWDIQMESPVVKLSFRALRLLIRHCYFFHRICCSLIPSSSNPKTFSSTYWGLLDHNFHHSTSCLFRRCYSVPLSYYCSMPLYKPLERMASVEKIFCYSCPLTQHLGSTWHGRFVATVTGTHVLFSTSYFAAAYITFLSDIQRHCGWSGSGGCRSWATHDDSSRVVSSIIICLALQHKRFKWVV